MEAAMSQSEEDIKFEKQVAELVGDESALPADELISTIEREYPFFTLPMALRLSRARNNVSESERRLLMSRLAINSPNRNALFRLIDADGERLSDFYPEEVTETPTTDSALDTFLDVYGKIDPHEQALLERMIFNPVPEYAGILAKEAEAEHAAEADSQDARLEAFLKGRTTTPSSAKPDPEAPLSESLAKIYIKQRRFDKAYEIIKSLSLNFPKKSAYFADQLRFLQKLILNNKYKQ